MNTHFEKPYEKKVSIKNVRFNTTKAPYTPDRYGECDFIVCRQGWKNIVKDGESRIDFAVSSDHFCVASKIRLKLCEQDKKDEDPGRFTFWPPDGDTKEHFSKILKGKMSEGSFCEKKGGRGI